jgi:hypothetical protein
MTTSPPKNWQLYKRDLKTNRITKAHADWPAMTEDETNSCLKAYEGTYQHYFHHFASPVVEAWETETA